MYKYFTSKEIYKGIKYYTHIRSTKGFPPAVMAAYSVALSVSLSEAASKSHHFVILLNGAQ